MAPPSKRASRARRMNTGSDLGARIVAAVPAIAFAIFIVAQGGLVFTLGLLALGIACMHELFAMFPAARPVKLAGFLTLAGLLLAANYGDQYEILLAAMLGIPLTFLLVQLQPRGGAPAIAVTFMGIYWIGFAFAHAVLLRALPHGDAIVIDVLVGTFIGDTGAYLGGRAIGSRKLAPSISPNKTLEGLVIGIVTAVIAVWFAGLYQDWLSGVDAILLGLGVAIAAPIGDLFESYLKRDAGTKDTGTLFGPHGGALDRLDAAMFTLVAGYYIWHAMA
jgi:phosphatidate cytidylyltransferase